MARFTPIKVNYVAFYFREWLYATSIMSTMERGIYSSLCFSIYEAGGRLENKTSLLASLSGLSELEFNTYWSRLKHKFVHEGDYLYHKRCTIELKKTFRLAEAGKKGAEKRWKTGKNDSIVNAVPPMGGHRVANSPPMLLNKTNTKPNNTKETKQNINPVFNSILDKVKPLDSDKTNSSYLVKDKVRESEKLVLNGALRTFLTISNNSQRTALNNICQWAAYQTIEEEQRKAFYKRIIDLANEAMTNAKTNRWGYFYSLLRRELGYVPGKIVN